MKQILLICSLLVVVSCGTTPYVENEEPKGEFLYIDIDGFFEGKNEEEIKNISRTAHLTCENEKLTISSPDIPSGPGIDPSLTMAIFARASHQRQIYYDNCMELKGFTKVWIPFEENAQP
jgi:hypothetical protein